MIALLTIFLSGCANPNLLNIKAPAELMKKPIPLQKL